ncbi:MAG TPA: hydroxymethylbilane synthase [Candidatus Acidoferrales bacterium]|nr:hydroxymethylbilane synthase [Bryobacteraceae bacterium]HTS65289.1 hydroxymethylbilane synthase [Candidatus Acidoferrales bacterium]
MLVIASRGSQLALWQARWVSARLAELGHQCRIDIIKTTGDKITDVPLAKVGTKGLFTKEIEEALLDGRADLAVHSLKDLPTELPAGLALAAVPEREDPRDAVLGRKLADLPTGAKVGTSSLRRAAQLRKLRPDLAIESVRGNLDTRIRKLDEGQYDAIVLAAAGLKRLGWADRIAEILDADRMCSAVGQGALAIETQASGAGFEACRALDHTATRAAVLAERGVLGALGGGCQVPIGAYATVADGRVRVQAIVASPDGEELIRGEDEGPAADATAIGGRLGAELLRQGAARILEAVYG